MSLSETRCSGPRYRRYDRSAPSFTYKETAGTVSGMRVATEMGMTASSMAAGLVQTDMRLARSQSPVVRGGQFSRVQRGQRSCANHSLSQPVMKLASLIADRKSVV